MEVAWTQRQIERYASDGNRLLRRLAEAEVDDFFLRRALDLLRTYLEIPRDARSSHRAGGIMVRLALSLYTFVQPRGYWDEIRFLWPKVKLIADQLPDPAIKAEITKGLAVIQNNRGEAGEAHRAYEELLADPDFEVLAPEQQADILHQHGFCYLSQGKYAAARESFERAISVANAFPQTDLAVCRLNKIDDVLPPIRVSPPTWESKAYALNQLGNIALYHGDYSGALGYYKRSLATFQANGEGENLACVAYQALGRLFVMHKQFTEAIPILEKGLAIRRRRRDPQHEATTATYLAAAYMESGRVDEAETLLNSALQMCQRLKDSTGRALCHLYFGHLEVKRGNGEAAMAQWQQALGLLEAAPMPAIELQVLISLLPNLLRVGRYRTFGTAFIRLIANLHCQRLDVVTLWRLLRQQQKARHRSASMQRFSLDSL